MTKDLKNSSYLLYDSWLILVSIWISIAHTLPTALRRGINKSLKCGTEASEKMTITHVHKKGQEENMELLFLLLQIKN